MVTGKLLLRPHTLPLTIFSPKHSFLPKHPKFTLFSSQSQTLTLNEAHKHFQYGPSLLKGTNPNSPFKTVDNDSKIGDFDAEMFTRVYEMAAIRVPSEDCFALENRLRGHLLNWPKVRNIARVPGDEVDDGVLHLLGDNRVEKSDNVDSLERRIHGKSESDGENLSPILYRDKLVKSFNSKGFVKFRNLAKISRPRKGKNEERDGGKKGIGKSDVVLVEVLGDFEEGEDLRGLLGDEFKGRKWRGSTRLLLLDEQYAGKGVDELPEAVKAVLRDDSRRSSASIIELVKCKLTLFYDYWQMNEVLEVLIPKDMIVPSSFETVGHIAHLNLRDEHLPYKKLIAKVVLDKNKPKIQTVVNKIDAIHNDYRTMQLEVLAGNHSLVTTLVENGMRFHVDLSTVYWNSKLATERLRLISCFTHSDVICDVFSGVGPIAISAANKVKYVYANDLNPYAVEYLERNSVLNKVERKIEVFNMDGRRFINSLFGSQKGQTVTQVVMNLPKDAAEYLDAFKGIFGKRSKDQEFKLPIIHVYGFSKAQDPEFDFHERIRIALSEVGVDVKMRRVRLVAPGKWMLCASFVLPQSVAFAKTMSNL